MPPAPSPDHPHHLIEEFRALPASSDRRREIVAELDGNAEALPFLASVVADPQEYDLARVEAATILRLWPPSDPATARTAAQALLAALRDPEDDLVRQYAAAALGPYADEPAVDQALATALRPDEEPLVRDNALAAVEEAGPSDARTDVLRALTRDPDLGRAAARILTAWGRDLGA
ncbi:HEAT repeat domain-containing protein [Streptomyces sp. NBC_00846]|uniref:HEAT repeat domain-containing protein n=1 Tax=Streptomyces sp. NBC_00846 TaxID=2975849 RepID=UPI00386D77E7|nr:HEAT repeat domain-containing protein [Streptomyces sp. NBC_00846]